jgi:hypothetical protein
MMVDTQVLSYAYKGQEVGLAGARISSVVAHEFLELYEPSSPTSFRYYIKYRSGRHLGVPSEAPAQWKSGGLERLVFDFGSDYPTLVEFNSRATAAIINDRNSPAFNHLVSSLDKSLQKKLRPRFVFLCEHVEECVPLASQTAEMGIDLLWNFVQRHNVKSNFRNSVNDMMILATAIAGGEHLLTRDDLLARFTAAQHGAPVREFSPGLIEIDFAREPVAVKRRPKESKGYINRGWRIAIQTGRRPPQA